MFLRILGGGIVFILFAVLGTLSAVTLTKTSDVDKRLYVSEKTLKDHEKEIKKLHEEILALEKKMKGIADPQGGSWGYEGDLGPDRWGAKYASCGNGKAQAPLNIVGPFEKAATTLKTEYKPGVLRVVNDGRSLQINVPPGNTLKVGAESYELQHISFHRPSQEQVDGKPMAMGAHLVHKGANGKVVVVAVMMRESAVQNRALWSIWKNLPAKAGPEVTVSSVSVNPASLLPESLAHYAYEGSLTAPPCTEGVQYFVMKAPIGIQKELIDSFPFKMNSRPVQPLNGRKISAS
ncbi:MAG: Carbonic anhydrase precursor [Pseudomonadota bacterium]|jgi:carbonic anhydrase